MDAWKAELLYQPVTAVRLRGSYQRAVRVPSIFELFLPGTVEASSTFDPPSPAACPANSGTWSDDAQLVEALCVEQGVPVELLPVYDEFEVLTTVGGNADLDPEKADTVTAGIVVRPGFESSWVHDLQFTIDWYRIEIDDVVTLMDTVPPSLTASTPRSIRPTLPTTTGARCSVAIRPQGRSSAPLTRSTTLPPR